MGVNYNDANYSPSLSGYSGVKPFRFWCQKVLPLVYDDSLSYYELLNKVVDYLNKTIEDVANVEDNVGALNDSYNQLQSHVNEALGTFRDYINNYFDNLDVQNEINAKLDEMASSGALWDLIQPYASQEIPGLVTGWLSKNVNPVGSAVVVDGSLTIAGAAADAKATGDALGDLKSAINSVSTSKIAYAEIKPTWDSGYIKSSDGTPAPSNSYHHTNRIPVFPGQCIQVENVVGSGNVSLFAIYDSQNNFTSYATGNALQSVRSLATENRTENIIYVVISSNTSQNTIIRLSSPLITELVRANKAEYITTSDYVNSSGNVISVYGLNQYLTTPMFVTKGSRVVVTSTGSANTAQIIKCTKYGAPIEVLTMNTGSVLTSTVVAVDDMYFMAYTNTLMGDLTVYIIDNKVEQTGLNNFNLVMPTVSFVFDDGTTEDANAVDVFRAHNKRCSFALLSTITQDARMSDYLMYQNDGFEILSHSTDGRTMNGYSGADIKEESVAISCMSNSKKALTDAGFDIHGWVTPSGRLNPNWVKDVKKYYDYAFCLTNETYNDPSETPYYERNISAFSIFRISLQSTTVAMWKDAIDRAIAAGGMVVFYGHSVKETSTDNLTISTLDEILTYLDKLSNSVQVLPCNTAMRYFFKVTHEDFINA